MFFVRSGEQNPCPCCGGSLKVVGSRERKYINGIGEKVVLVIRRLQCSHCTKVHHELPDILTPYKRYGSESIEAVVSGESELTVAADESTITRWKHWFQESCQLPGQCPGVHCNPLLSSVCGRRIQPPSVSAPKDLAASRERSSMASQNCPSGGKRKLLGTYPFCITVRVDKQ
ncbi:MAG: DUF6431 domain-containing protein [Bacillota bacterium]